MLLLVVVIDICIPEMIASGIYANFMFPIKVQADPKIQSIVSYHFEKKVNSCSRYDLYIVLLYSVRF